MNKAVTISFIILSVSLNIKAQNKSDYKWVMGLQRAELRGGNIIDFDNKRSIDTSFIAFAMGSNCVSICDKEGNLLMYSNGCAIADRTHKIMENGDSINFGEAWQDFCPYKYSEGYPVTQNSLILPDPGNYDDELNQVKNGYYLLHKRSELLFEPKIHSWTPGVSYSYVDMNGNKGNGKVIKKNKLIFETKSLTQGYMTACKHANGRDWWIVQIREDTNIFFKILLTKDTVMVVDSQRIGNFKFKEGNNQGQAVFTPDGSKWVAFNSKEKAIVLDFNRTTGELSNLRQINPQDSGRFVGVAVSPNSRFAYLSALTDLYQIDLWADDIQASIAHIAHIDYFPDPNFISVFSLAQLGPDCKIYIVNAGTNNYLHVINKPNEKGQACDFQQHYFYLPNLNYNGSLPNFPHFRMDEAEVCDSTLTSIFGELVWLRRDMKVWPNPSSGIFNIELPDVGAGKLVVTNINGQVIYERDVSNIINEERIDISNYPGGRYNVEYWPDRNVRSKSGDFDHRDNRVFYGVQVVKVE
jgi:hypothetical protein